MFNFLKENAILNIKKIISNSGILFLEPELASIFNLISIKIFKQIGISTFCYFEDKPLVIKADHIYYLLRPRTSICKLICQYIENNKNSIHHIIFVPQSNITCQRIFEYHGSELDLC